MSEETPTTEEILNPLNINPERDQVTTENEKMVSITGLDPADNNYHLQISIDEAYGDLLQATSLQEYQDRLTEILKENISSNFSEINYNGDTLFITNITVAPNATGIDYHGKNNTHEHQYSHHNIDTAKQAIEVIAVVEDWIKYTQTVFAIKSEESDLKHRITSI